MRLIHFRCLGVWLWQGLYYEHIGRVREQWPKLKSTCTYYITFSGFKIIIIFIRLRMETAIGVIPTRYEIHQRHNNNSFAHVPGRVFHITDMTYTALDNGISHSKCDIDITTIISQDYYRKI